jgi:hypothetical protein
MVFQEPLETHQGNDLVRLNHSADALQQKQSSELLLGQIQEIQ